MRNIMHTKKILIIEFSPSHSEILYSQWLFAKQSGYQISLLCDITYRDKSILEAFDHVYDFVLSESLWKRYLIQAKQVRDIIIKNKFDFVVFNTVNGNFLRFLSLLPFPKQIQFLGIVHIKKKLDTSFSLKVISRWIKKYYILSDYILDFPIQNKAIQFESFYSIYFPEFPACQLPIIKQPNELWIVVPGGIAIGYKKNQYQALFDLLLKAEIPSRIKFVIIGRYFENKAEVIAMLQQIQRKNNSVIFFEESLADPIFHQFIKESDFVMPLIHNDIDCQISGGFSLAYAYKKPLLCHEQLNAYAEFRENAIFYNDNNLLEILRQLSETGLPEDLQQRMYRDDRWNFETQRARYINFLQSY